MKRYQLRPPSGGEGDLDLILEETERPSPGPGEVLVRVRATSLNYRDLLMRKGQSASSAGDEGKVPLSDGAGDIAAVGEGVDRVAVGDRVVGCFFSHWVEGRFSMDYHQGALGGSADGMLAEYVVLPEEGVARFPDSLSYEEAACFPCAGLTAWYALVERGGLKLGDKVLLLGTGGVSIFALQLAEAFAAEVWITSSSDEKLERARRMGAAHTINYRTDEDWDKTVWKETGKAGVDHVVEVGGPGTIGKSMACVAAGGHLALIGVLTGFEPPSASLFPLVARNVRLNGIYVGHRTALENCFRFVDEKGIHPVVDRVFGFEEAPAAYEALAAGGHFGKIVISMEPQDDRQ